ncbi:MAG: hypothetical protein APR55_05545 [Methanolinea sp. SDB]|nr:MAG: hypothetical protein APR55_05545 [Methanolinea sp. SDB]
MPVFIPRASFESAHCIELPCEKDPSELTTVLVDIPCVSGGLGGSRVALPTKHEKIPRIQIRIHITRYVFFNNVPPIYLYHKVSRSLFKGS